MEALTRVLEKLTTESRELLQQCEDTIVASLTSGSIRPSQVALLLAQQFTSNNAVHSYPSLCLLDLLLLHASSNGEGNSERVLALRSTLRELFPLLKTANGVLETYATAVEQKSTRDKGIRLVKRWQQRQLLWAACALAPKHAASVTAADKKKEQEEKEGYNAVLTTMIEKMEGRYAVPTPPPPPPTSGSDLPSPAGAEQVAPPATSTHSDAPANKETPVAVGGWTKAQVQHTRLLLHSCLQLLESLPIARARVYAELLAQEHVHTPTPSVYAFLQQLRMALKSEVERRSRGEQIEEEEQELGQEENDKASSEKKAHQPTDEERREALARLLGSLQRGSDNASSRLKRSGGSEGELLGHVTHYAHPLFSDKIYQQQITASRSVREALAPTPRQVLPLGNPAAPSEDLVTSRRTPSYYPKSFVPADGGGGRPFRIPFAVLHAQGNPYPGQGRRLPFPSEKVWLGERDMTQLVLFDSRDGQGSEVTRELGGSVPRKREREEEVEVEE